MKNKYNLDEIKQFWTGLMEGEGSIQVNHWQNKYLHYRLIIKLKYTEANSNMLKHIKMNLGGMVKEKITDKPEVIWVVNNTEEIITLAKIFNKYPPLTTRIFCQLEFLNTCLQYKPSIEEYLIKRKLKFAQQIDLAKARNLKNLELPSHFNIWLSGFTESRGCFSNSYSISQKTDRYIIEAIKQFWNMPSKVRETSKDFWTIETSNKKTLKNIVHHFDAYPLIGEKAIQFSTFKQELKLFL